MANNFFLNSNIAKPGDVLHIIGDCVQTHSWSSFFLSSSETWVAVASGTEIYATSVWMTYITEDNGICDNSYTNHLLMVTDNWYGQFISTDDFTLFSGFEIGVTIMIFIVIWFIHFLKI